MASHNLAHITIDDLDIIGYSVGGEETVIAVPQLDVCFDIGKAPDQFVPINHVLLTHGHMITPRASPITCPTASLRPHRAQS